MIEFKKFLSEKISGNTFLIDGIEVEITITSKGFMTLKCDDHTMYGQLSKSFFQISHISGISLWNNASYHPDKEILDGFLNFCYNIWQTEYTLPDYIIEPDTE